jgi:hypothetical protein
MPDSAVNKYLNKYSDRGTTIEWNRDNEINTAVVIPAIQEYDNIRTLLKSLSNADASYFKNTLFVFVINNTPSSDLGVKEDNLKSLELLANIKNNSTGDDLIRSISKSGLQTGYLDACSPGNEMPEKEGGVGLARKIGMDAALNVFNYEQKEKKNLLICLDADCTVKENYLTEIHTCFYNNDIGAASIYFEHLLSGHEHEDSAIICYEIFLRYYVMGLRYAGSYYAFHTIGSAMACDHETYVKTEGMNKKKAAEDFYFLEKISKHTRIKEIRSTAVYPSKRKSWRVPFGTGQRVTRFHARTHDEYSLYNPLIFEVLKEWLQIFHIGEIIGADKYLLQAKSISEGLFEFLQIQNFKSALDSILKSSKTTEQIRRQQLGWFDGFRTLKFIHYLRDNYLPNLHMPDALQIMLGKYDVTAPETAYVNFSRHQLLSEYLLRLRFLDSKL